MTGDFKDRIKGFLTRRKRAYVHTFNVEDVFTQQVLADLSKFCRADEATFHPDARVHAVLEGRREVWLRIRNHLKLSEEQLMKIYAQKDAQ